MLWKLPLAAAKNGELAIQNDAAPVAAFNDKEPAAEPAKEIPEITLDDSLPDKNADEEELRRVAEQIGAANSLEDITDVMAETIFGSQALDEIAAAVVANPPEQEESSPVMLDDNESAGAQSPQQPDTGAPQAKDPAGIEPAPIAEDAAQRLDMVKALNNGVANTPPVESIEMSSGPKQALQDSPRPRGPQPEPH